MDSGCEFTGWNEPLMRFQLGLGLRSGSEVHQQLVRKDVHPVHGNGFGELIGAREILLEEFLFDTRRKSRIGSGDVLFLAKPEAEMVEIGRTEA